MGFRSGCFHGKKDLWCSSYGCWRAIPHINLVELQKCGKKCRNYLKPCLKRGASSLPQQKHIFKAPSAVKTRWSMKAKLLPGRTDSKIEKMIWNSCVKKKQIQMGIDQNNHTSNNSSIALQVREKESSYTENNIEDSSTNSVKETDFQIERNGSYDLNILVESAQDLSCYEKAELANWYGLHSQTEILDDTECFIWDKLPAMIEEEEESDAPDMKMDKMGKS